MRLITVEKIENPARFKALQSEWRELLESSTCDCIFLTWEWLYVWWQHFSEDRRLHIITVRNDDELVAIAPLTLRPSRWRRLLPFATLEFLGTGLVGSDYLDVLIRRGEERGVFPELARGLASGKQMLELSSVKRATAHVGGLVAAITQRGWFSNQVPTDVCPYIDLSGHDWESYLAGLGPAHRCNLRRRLRNLSKRWRVEFEQVRSEEHRAAALRTLIELHGRRWRARDVRGAFHDSPQIAFHEEFSRIALERGWLRLYVLRLDERPVAALYGFFYNDVFYFYQSGFDPDYRQYSVGLVTMGLAIKSAIEEGAKRYEFLRGDEPYKSLWTHAKHQLVRFKLFPPGERGALYRVAMGLRGGIKKMALLLYLPGES